MLKKFKRVLGVILVAAIAGAAGAFTFLELNHSGTTLEQTTGYSQPARFAVYANDNAVAPTNFTSAAETSVPGVVHVKTTYVMSSPYSGSNSNPFRDFFWGDRGRVPHQPSGGSGSGVIISDDGYIVTNNHVIENAEQVEVTLNDKRTYTAKIIGVDPSTDLALLKVDDSGLPFLAFGNSDKVQVGEWVLAVGNPFNLTSTVTAGIVSAKGRNINILPNQRFPIESFIQTDAAVNPGNSGGALVSTNGDLIGINTAIASNTGAYTGYSFAVPVNIVQKVVDDLIEYGSVQRAFIGVSIRDIDSKLADEKNMKTLSGVYVAGLTDGGAAADAGIEEGDIILSVGDVIVSSSPELQEQVSRYRPGDKIKVELLRGTSQKTVAVTLRNKNGNTDIVKSDMVSLLGAQFQTITEKEMGDLGIDHGVQISELNGGKFRSAGIREGFIIQSIDKKPITSVNDIKLALDKKKGGVLIEGIYPNGMRAYYGFGM